MTESDKLTVVEQQFRAAMEREMAEDIESASCEEEREFKRTMARYVESLWEGKPDHEQRKEAFLKAAITWFNVEDQMEADGE